LNGALEWSFTTGATATKSPTICDIDGDGDLEALFPGQDNILYCISKDGIEEWRYTTAGAVTQFPVVADIDLDGKVEVIIGSEDFKLYCLDG